MSSFIEIKYGIVKKESVSGLTRAKGQYPWNGKTHWDIEVQTNSKKRVKMNNPIIIDVEWREVSCSTEAVFEPKVMVQKQKWNKVDKVIFTLFYSIIAFIVLRFMYGCYTNYMFWSEHDGVTLHKVLFGMP